MYHGAVPMPLPNFNSKKLFADAPATGHLRANSKPSGANWGLGNTQVLFVPAPCRHGLSCDRRSGSGETNRISARGNPTLCTSAVVPGGLPRAIPVSAMQKTIQKDKTKQIEYISSAHVGYKSIGTESNRNKSSSSVSMKARGTPNPQAARA
jgi:hypothetical protein